MIPIISQIPEPYSTVILLALIIAVFVVAYKVMKIVMQTALISVLSGIYYVVLVYTIGLPFELNNILFYSLLGASLYLAFVFISTAFKTAERIVLIPYEIAKLIYKTIKGFLTGISGIGTKLNLRKRIKWVKNLFNNRKDYSPDTVNANKQKDKKKDSDSSSDEKNPSGNETKEVVLDKVMKEENGDDKNDD